MPVPRSVLTAAAAACAVAATTAPARAMSEVHRDAAQDVVSGSLESGVPPVRPEPARRVGDIVRTNVSYGDDLVVTTRFRSLAAIGHQEFSWTILAAGARPPNSFDATLVVRAGQDHGTLTFLDPLANQPGCAKASLDRPDRTVTLVVPGSCLLDTASVRVASGFRLFSGTGAAAVHHADDARRDGEVRQRWKYGPRLARGQ